MKQGTEEIRWKTNKRYVDIETGELITETLAKQKYVIIKSKTVKHVYKSTGTIEITNECKTSRQTRLFE